MNVRRMDGVFNLNPYQYSRDVNGAIRLEYVHVISHRLRLELPYK